ncbi:AB-hydrolase lipase domain [Trinorchestia longiramus]|nr:AB-hydrolase lipase domain [Trinorchestia longiramus]
MRLSDTGMLVVSPPKFVRGPKSRVSRSSPCFVKSQVLSSKAWAWCLLMPLMLQVKLVFAKDPSEAIDSVLNKYDHARSHGNHGRAWFGQGQDHGLLRLDVQQERDALKKYLNDALEKRLFAEDNANDQNGRQFKKINERMIPSGDLVNVINELDRNRKKLNLDSSRGVALLNEVQATGESAVEQKMKLNQKFTVTGKAGVNVETKTSSVQEKKPGEKVNKVVTKVKMAENTSSRKRWKTGSRSRPRRDVMGLPSPPPSMSMPGLILAHGYPAEVHHVKTEDGYILELHRIPGPRLLDTSPKKRRRNNRRVGRGRRDAAESYDPNDILVALERERIEGWLQNGNLEVLLQSNDVVKEIIGLDDLHVSETFVRENEEHYKDIPVPSHENEYLFATGFPEKLSRSKRSEAQRNMMQRRQMIQNVHPRALLSMVRRGRSHGSRFRPRPQASGRYPQRSHRRSFQRPRRRSHTPSNLRRTMRDRTMVLPRENSLDLSPSKTRKGLPAGIVSSLDNCNNFTANCANSNLNSGTARAARQITQLRNSKLNENNSNFPDNDFIDGDLNEIDSDHFGKNSSSSEHRNKISKPGIEAKKVVFIQHCLQCSSADFVLNDHNQALAFILADEGYDVWLGNFRGNQYSRGHVSLSPKSIKYWQFT